MELSEWVLTKYSNPEKTEKGMASASSKDVSSSGVLTECVRIELRPCSKSLTAWSKKSNPYNLVQVGSQLVLRPFP